MICVGGLLGDLRLLLHHVHLGLLEASDLGVHGRLDLPIYHLFGTKGSQVRLEHLISVLIQLIHTLSK